MKKTIILLSIIISMLSAKSDLISFYKDVLKTLFFQENLDFQKQAREFEIKAKRKDRFLHLNATVFYDVTDAKLLPKNYHTTDITVTDTIDIFSKASNDIDILKLQSKEDKLLIQRKKEKIFLKLLDMITNYRLSEERYKNLKKLYKNEKIFLKQLKSALKTGAISPYKLTQLENKTILLKVQLDEEKGMLKLMKKQLELYSKNKPIPHLAINKLYGSLKRFLFFSPSLRLNNNQVLQMLIKAKKLQRNYLPDGLVKINQQYSDDPTTNGNNRTISIGLHTKFNGGNSFEYEKQKVKILQIKTLKKELQIQRTMQYNRWKNRYETAKKSFYRLKKTLSQTKKSLDFIQDAYLKNYIDLNSYLQILQEYLKILDNELLYKYIMIKNATILNMLSSGKIYH